MYCICLDFLPEGDYSGEKQVPLFWDAQRLVFDTEAAANRFLNDAINNGSHDEAFYEGAYILPISNPKERDLNATNKTIKYMGTDSDEEELVDLND